MIALTLCRVFTFVSLLAQSFGLVLACCCLRLHVCDCYNCFYALPRFGNCCVGVSVFAMLWSLLHFGLVCGSRHVSGSLLMICFETTINGPETVYIYIYNIYIYI